LIEVSPGFFFHTEAIEKARELIVQTIQTQGELIAADFRDSLKTSRKYIIPLLEYFDQIGLTVRKGNSRILKKADM
jgi:selenocysteine-specific elongation factor